MIVKNYKENDIYLLNNKNVNKLKNIPSLIKDNNI